VGPPLGNPSPPISGKALAHSSFSITVTLISDKCVSTP
jgi:hypothetical protein